MKLLLPNFQPGDDLKVEEIDYSQVMKKETPEESVSTPPFGDSLGQFCDCCAVL